VVGVLVPLDFTRAAALRQDDEAWSSMIDPPLAMVAVTLS
jgi:hypothetical protein